MATRHSKLDQDSDRAQAQIERRVNEGRRPGPPKTIRQTFSDSVEAFTPPETVSRDHDRPENRIPNSGPNQAA